MENIWDVGSNNNSFNIDNRQGMLYDILREMKFLIIIVLLFNIVTAEIISYDSIKWYVVKECKLYPSKLINEKLIHAIMFYESRVSNDCYNTSAVSSEGSMGLMQIHINTLIDFNIRYDKKIAMDDMKNKYKNIKMGIWCLSMKLKQSKGCLWKALYFYNGAARRSFEYANLVINKALLYYIYK